MATDTDHVLHRSEFLHDDTCAVCAAHRVGIENALDDARHLLLRELHDALRMADIARPESGAVLWAKAIRTVRLQGEALDVIRDTMNVKRGSGA